MKKISDNVLNMPLCLRFLTHMLHTLISYTFLDSKGLSPNFASNKKRIERIISYSPIHCRWFFIIPGPIEVNSFMTNVPIIQRPVNGLTGFDMIGTFVMKELMSSAASICFYKIVPHWSSSRFQHEVWSWSFVHSHWLAFMLWFHLKFPLLMSFLIEAVFFILNCLFSGSRF